MVEPVVLEGRLVRLEPVCLDHVQALLSAASFRRDTYAFTTVPADLASMTEYVETALAWQAEGTALPFATVDPATRKVVGSTRFFDLQFWSWEEGSTHQRGPDLPDALEIGHTWLAPHVQRTGINTEAKLLMLTHAFEVWRVHRVRLTTDALNERSRRAIERLGARLDGVLRGVRATEGDRIRDSAYYSILDSEWPDVKKALAARLR
jgi:N-acetyltransferase